MANQFSRRGPPDRIKKGHDDSTKDKIRAEMLSKRLEKFAKARGKQIAKYHMEPAQVQAAKVLIERGKPALQAITQEVINPHDQMSDEELREQAKALISAKVSLVCELLDSNAGFRASIQAHLAGKPVAVEHQSAATQQ
jgi:hypothetical protein